MDYYIKAFYYYVVVFLAKQFYETKHPIYCKILLIFMYCFWKFKEFLVSYITQSLSHDCPIDNNGVLVIAGRIYTIFVLIVMDVSIGRIPSLVA